MADLNVSLLLKLVDRVSGPARRVRTAALRTFQDIKAAQAASFREGKKTADLHFQQAANIRQAAEGVSRFASTARSIVGAPISVAEDFEESMSRVKAITQGTDSQMQRMRNTAIDLGAKTAFSASQSADAMFEMAKRGFTVDETIASMAGTLDLAASSGVELARAAEISSGLLNAFNLNASQAGQVADVLAAAANNSGADLEGLAETMKYAAPVARTFGLTLEQTTAMAGKLADVGIKGSQAGTALRTSLLNLANPRGMQKQALSFLNISTVDRQTKQLRPFAAILEEIDRKSQKYGQAGRAKIVDAIFGSEGAPAVLELMSQARSGGLSKFTDQLENSAGTAARVAEDMLDNSKGATEQLAGSWETLMIRIGDAGLPTLTSLKLSLVDTINSVTDWVTKHPALTKVIFGSIAAVAALATALTGLLFTMAAVKSAKGVLSLIDGYKEFASILRGKVVVAIASFVKSLVVGMARAVAASLPGLASLATRMWAVVAPTLAAAAPFLAVAAAIGAVTLAVVQLVKHWKELNFLEGLEGITQNLLDNGILDTLGELFDPRTLLKDIGVMGGQTPLAPPRTALNNPNAKPQQVEGTVKIQIDSEGRPAIKQMASNGGIGLDVSAGMAMVSP